MMSTKQKLDALQDVLTRRITEGVNVGSEAAFDLLYQNWLYRKTVNMPVEDALKNGFEYSGDTKAFEDELKRLKVITKIKQAQQKARLYGGSAILIVPKEKNGADLKNPLVVENIKQIVRLNVISGFQAQVSKYDDDPLSATYKEVELWNINGGNVHSSRVIPFIGDDIGDNANLILPKPFGQSVLLTQLDALEQYEKQAKQNTKITEILLLKVLKMKGLMDLLENEETKELIKTRVDIFNSAEISDYTAVIDIEEDILLKNQSLSGIKDIQTFTKDNLAGATRIPSSKFFSQQLGTLAGANETTDDYSSFLETVQNLMSDQVDTIFQMIATITKTKDFSWKFASVEHISEKEVAETRRIQAFTDKIYYDTQVLNAKEIRDSRFSGEKYSFETTLNNDTPPKV